MGRTKKFHFIFSKNISFPPFPNHLLLDRRLLLNEYKTYLDVFLHVKRHNSAGFSLWEWKPIAELHGGIVSSYYGVVYAHVTNFTHVVTESLEVVSENMNFK